MTENSINNILNINFKTLPFAEKVKIKGQGRPIPILNLHQQDKIGTRTFTRHFSQEVYNNFNWISGCDKLNALFCFPCVLFYSNGMDKTWSVTGYTDLKHLKQRAKKHEISARHMNCCTELALLGSAKITVQLNSVYRQNVMKHNEQVTRNRYILKRMINCIKFCGKLELASIGRDEKEDFENCGVFRELIDFSSELDTILKEHLSNATVFKAASKTVQNEILDSMLAVCRQEVKEQIDRSEFLAVQFDETTDISNQCQMVFIVRYLHNGHLYERFWTFIRAPKSALSLTQHIESVLDTLISNSPSQLIAQTYDGGIRTKIVDKYKHAHFVHCYAHQLHLIIQKATSRIAKVKTFFSNLSSIPNFFSSCTHKCDLFEEIVERKLQKIACAICCYNIRTVNIVFENRDKLIDCFEELEERCNKTVTCKEAYALRRTLEDPNFVFWLNLFNKIFPHVDTLINQFQNSNRDSSELQKYLEEFEQIVSIRNSTDELDHETGDKRRKISQDNKSSVMAEAVCDTIILQLKERLSYRGHLEAASLVNMENFLRYSQEFPTTTLNSVVGFYPMLQQDKLRTELEVIYSRRDFRNFVGCLNMLSWLSDNGLNETFSETVKILKIIVTTPMSTAESERCFPTLERIKALLGNTMKEERLNALAMMSVNKNLIHDVSNFDEKVIEHFISHLQQDRRLDFVYKQ